MMYLFFILIDSYGVLQYVIHFNEHNDTTIAYSDMLVMCRSRYLNFKLSENVVQT
jgi:hypothetical protein